MCVRVCTWACIFVCAHVHACHTFTHTHSMQVHAFLSRAYQRKFLHAHARSCTLTQLSFLSHSLSRTDTRTGKKTKNTPTTFPTRPHPHTNRWGRCTNEFEEKTFRWWAAGNRTIDWWFVKIHLDKYILSSCLFVYSKIVLNCCVVRRTKSFSETSSPLEISWCQRRLTPCVTNPNDWLGVVLPKWSNWREDLSC